MSNIFIDTNILVYISLEENEWHKKSLEYVTEIAKTHSLFISNQIILEYINVVTNEKLFKSNALTIKEALNNIDSFLSFIKLTEKNPSYEDIKKSTLKYKITRNKLFDLNIYLTMLENNIECVLTQNKKDFSLFNNITVYSL